MPTIRIYSKPCPVCKQTQQFDLDEAAYRRWKAGELIQRCFPELTTDERERLITGLHGECWKTYLGPEPEE